MPNVTEEKALEVVRDFLSDYYRDQPSKDLAAAEAVRDYSDDFHRHFLLAQAFDVVLAASLPERTLLKLVESAGNRMVVDDDEARAFLEMVYVDNMLQLAMDMDG